jgi:hypothetical protein
MSFLGGGGVFLTLVVGGFVVEVAVLEVGGGKGRGRGRGSSFFFSSSCDEQ